jgi:hypothetical protein
VRETAVSGHHRLTTLGWLGIIVVAAGGGLAVAAHVAWLWAVAATGLEA